MRRLLLTALSLAATTLLFAQSDTPPAPVTAADVILQKVQPFYEALQKSDWTTVSSYYLLTADSEPPRFYYEPLPLGIKTARWCLIKTYHVRHEPDPGQPAPDESVLTLSEYQHPGATPASAPGGLVQTRMDLWLRTHDTWRVLTGQEEHDTSSTRVTTARKGRGSGRQFDSLNALLLHASGDQKRLTELADRSKLIREYYADMEAVAQNLMKSERISAEKKAELQKHIDQLRAKMQELSKTEAAGLKTQLENLKPARTGTAPK